MRRGTFVVLIVLFGVLVAAAIYQFTIGQHPSHRLCGPASPGAVPRRGACRTPKP